MVGPNTVVFRVFPRVTKCTYEKFGQSGTIEVLPKCFSSSKIYFMSDPRRTLPAANQRCKREDLRLPLVLASPPCSCYESLCRLSTGCYLQRLLPKQPYPEEIKTQVQNRLLNKDSSKRPERQNFKKKYT